MRVKFGNHIDLCKRITHSDGSKLLLITTINNSLYTVNCEYVSVARNLHNKALIDGYIDVSDYDYSNL